MVASQALDRLPEDNFDVAFVGSNGQDHCGLLSSLWMTPFEQVLPVRRFSSFRGKRSFAGLWWFATTAEHVGFESWVERDQLMALDFDRSVVGVSSQPFRLSWSTAGRSRSHVPDYFARLVDGTGVVIDVRPDDRIEPEDAEVFTATAQACGMVGWSFRRVGTVDAVFAANLRWLAGYRHSRCLHAGRAMDLQRVFREPTPLLAGARRVGDPIAVLPTLFHLIWRQALRADLRSAPLGGSSQVWCSAESDR